MFTFIEWFFYADFLFLKEANECESAKDMFGGRLTSDMVLEKLGHCDYTDITYLTLQSCSIR